VVQKLTRVANTPAASRGTSRTTPAATARHP